MMEKSAISYIYISLAAQFDENEKIDLMLETLAQSNLCRDPHSFLNYHCCYAF